MKWLALNRVRWPVVARWTVIIALVALSVLWLGQGRLPHGGGRVGSLVWRCWIADGSMSCMLASEEGAREMDAQRVKYVIGTHWSSALPLPDGYASWSWTNASTSPVKPFGFQFTVPVWPAVAACAGCVLVLSWRWLKARRGRRRLVAGVLTIGVGVLLAAAVARSGFRPVRINAAPGWVTFANGLVLVERESAGVVEGRIGFWYFAAREKSASLRAGRGWWLLWSMGAYGEGFAFPAWTLIVGALGGGALLLVYGVRAGRRGEFACRRCGYDLRGLGESAACPECGANTAVRSDGIEARSVRY